MKKAIKVLIILVILGFVLYKVMEHFCPFQEKDLKETDEDAAEEEKKESLAGRIKAKAKKVIG